MAPKCHVLFADHCADLSAGGAQRVLLEILSSLDRERFGLFAAIPAHREGPLARDLPPDVQRVAYEPRVPGGPHRRWPSYLRFAGAVPYTALSLARLSRRHGIDVLYANTILAGVTLAAVRRLTGLPLVYHEHNLVEQRPDTAAWRALFRFVAGTATRVIAISQAVSCSLTAHGVEPQKINVVYNGMRAPEYSDDELTSLRQRGRTRLRLRATEGPVVGMVAHLRPWKGQLSLLRTFDAVRQRFPDIRYVLVGEPADVDYARQVGELARNDAFCDRVRILGYQEQVQELMAAMDIVVCASDREPFGLVILEAMHLSRPVVAFDVGGPAEIIRHGRTGLLVRNGDVPGLAAAILELLEDPSHAQRLGQAGRAEAAADFSLQAQKRRLESVLTQLCLADPTAS